MVKVFIPQEKQKYNKAGLARGFWRSDTGKVYYDYIKVTEYNQIIEGLYYKDIFLNYLENIKSGYNQECIFYKVNDIGYVYYSRDKIEVLPGRIYTEVSRVDLKQGIKQALKAYGGVTIYQEGKKYFKEVFFKPEA